MFFAAIALLVSKDLGKMYNMKVANTDVPLIFIGFNTLYFPMLISGLQGLPRRYYDYLPEFTVNNVISTVGSWILIIGIIMMIWNFIAARRNGKPAPKNPWNGLGLEWQTESPPTAHNFDEMPVLPEGGPYAYK